MAAAFTLTWDIYQLAAAMKISREEVEKYFKDGRRMSFIMERTIRDEMNRRESGWKLAPSEGAGYDLVDGKGGKWEVRSISNSIYFSPSSMVGSKRKFEEAGFVAKLKSVEGYICADISEFPNVPVYIVPRDVVGKLHNDEMLGSRASISRAAFKSRIVPLLK